MKRKLWHDGKSGSSSLHWERSTARPYDWTQFLITLYFPYQFSSVAQSCQTLCDPMNCSTPGLPVHHQLPEFTQTQLPSSPWCHPAISSSVVPFSSCPQSLPATKSFPMSQLFAWGSQSTGVSALASFLPKKSHGVNLYKCFCHQDILTFHYYHSNSVHFFTQWIIVLQK